MEEEAEPNPLLELKEIVSSRCTCKPEIETMINKAVCRCPRCVEDAHSRFKHITMIGGYKETEDETLEKIIEGIKPHKTECDCLRKYRESVKQYESWKIRNQVVEQIKSAKEKFIIGGVVNRPNQPPVFIISGIIPKRECYWCAQLLKAEEAEKERLARMPKKLLGLRYLISGVTETPEGNVYVISGVQDKKQCKCLHLYHTFMKKHGKCFKLVEAYSEKMAEDLEEHMSELAECDEGEYERQIEFTGEEEESQTEYREENNQIVTCGDKCLEAHLEENVDDEVPVTPMDTTLTVKLEFNKDRVEEVCCCAESKETQEDVGLRRLIILGKFPTDTESQYEVLKVH